MALQPNSTDQNLGGRRWPRFRGQVTGLITGCPRPGQLSGRHAPRHNGDGHGRLSSAGSRRANPRLRPRPTGEREPDRNSTSGRVLILDDCRLFRECLAGTMEFSGNPEPVVAWDLSSLVQALSEADVGVVLLSMTTHGSHLLLRATMDIDPTIRVIVLGVSEDDETGIVACAEAGVVGYHMRSDSFDDLMVLIHKVVAGEICCPPTVAAILLQRLLTLTSQPPAVVQDLALTAREVQILGMLELGRSNRDIAERLDIAVHTVKNHVHSLLAKLGVTTRAQAAAMWRTYRSDRGTDWS